MRATQLREAVSSFHDIIPWKGQGDAATLKLLEKCQQFFQAQVAALYLVRERPDATNGGRRKYVELEAHVGYGRADGRLISMNELKEGLTYELTPPSEQRMGKYDGITGFVASAGVELGADSMEELQRIPSYQGKPNRLGIWSKTHPFRCMFAVPIVSRSQTLGVLKVENKNDGTFDEIDKAVLRLLARLFVVAIDHDELDRAHVLPLESRQRVEVVDRSDMARVIRGTPEQIAFALSDPAFPDLRHMHGKFDRVVVVGMGGSALPADVVNDAFEQSLVAPIQIQRHYYPPADIDARTLIVFSSFSGNTEETLGAMEKLQPGAQNVVVLTAGGRLAEVAPERGYPVIRVQREREVPGFQPRSATGYMATYLARLLMDVGALHEPAKAADDLRSLVKFLKERDLRPDGEQFAKTVGDAVPVFYTDQIHERSIGRIAKIKFNENAKRPAFFNTLPEANHNEMVGFSGRFGEFAFLYFLDPDSPKRIHERFDVMRSLFERKVYKHITFQQWTMPGVTRLQKIFASLTYADWISYSVAVQEGIDPTPVELVEDFKAELQRVPS